MKHDDRFRYHALALFFAVALFPAVTVSTLWYVLTRATTSGSLVSYGIVVLPIAILGLAPALVLSFFFVELLVQPIRRLHQAIDEISKGNFNFRSHFKKGSEFYEMAESLNGISSTMEEILSQKSGENELIVAERNKLRAVLDSMEDGVFAIDSSGRIMLFNKAAQEITGRSITEVAGQLSEKVMPLRRGEELVMASWLADRRVAKRELGEWRNLTLYRADGDKLFVDVRAIKLPSDPNGIQALVTFHDLTKSHNLEEMKVDFVSLAAHELRTPLTAIKGYLDVLETETEGELSVDQQQILARTIISARQLSGVVNNILNVSRIERGELALNFEIIDPKALVHNLKIDYDVRAQQQNRQLEVHYGSHLPAINVDLVGITEVMNNLVDNAINHTEPGGKIDIKLSFIKDNQELEIIVTDDGHGIPKAAIPKLFTKFYRVEGLHTTKGTGLGLFISKSILEAFGGRIWVESEEGHGASFSLRIPAAQLVAEKEHASHNSRTSGSMKGTHGWIKDHSIR